MRRRLLVGTGATVIIVLVMLVSALCYSALSGPSPSSSAANQGMIGREDDRRARLGYTAVVTPVPLRTRPAASAMLATPFPRPAVVSMAVAAPDPPRDDHAVLAEGAPVPPDSSPRYLSPQVTFPGQVYRPADSGAPVRPLDVAGNPRLYVGAHVHWFCVISRVPDPSFADAQCGPPLHSFAQPPLTEDELDNDPQAVRRSLRIAEHRLHHAQAALLRRVPIVLTGPIGDLDFGDAITIDGTVRSPLRGSNAFGVSRFYPTVHVDAMRRGY